MEDRIARQIRDELKDLNDNVQKLVPKSATTNNPFTQRRTRTTEELLRVPVNLDWSANLLPASAVITEDQDGMVEINIVLSKHDSRLVREMLPVLDPKQFELSVFEK